MSAAPPVRVEQIIARYTVLGARSSIGPGAGPTDPG